MATFDEFLKTGKLGPIELGLSREAVRDLLGEPGDTSVSKHPEIWKYGPVELAFDRPRPGSSPELISIIYQLHGPDIGPPPSVGLSGWMPSPGMSREDFSAHLDQSGISVSAESGWSLILGSEARVTFDDDGRIYGVGFSARDEPGPKFKQFSISVPEEDYDAIRREARVRGLSASALCSLWIGEQASALRAEKV